MKSKKEERKEEGREEEQRISESLGQRHKQKKWSDDSNKPLNASIQIVQFALIM